jgi:Domain of unknown function (DUF4062)
MKIFLSAVSGQLKACRDALRSDLSAVGAEVVVQEDFQQHGASLLKKLERYIASCDRIIALVGDAYGYEPEETARPAGQPRRSYTHFSPRKGTQPASGHASCHAPLSAVMMTIVSGVSARMASMTLPMLESSSSIASE